MQESIDHRNTTAQSLINKSGLIFALPQPVIYHKNDSFTISSQRTIKQHSVQQDSPRNKHLTRKKTKKNKQKARNTIEIQKNLQDKQKQQTSILRQTLYKKFMERGRVYPQFDPKNVIEKDKDKESTHSSNIKLRQLNLVVLSKRQEMKRENRMKGQKLLEKERERDKLTDRKTPSVKKTSPLPHFARSRSSFYKPQNNQYNTLAFLSKTIFSEISTHFTTRIPKQKAIQPLELGISKAKIVDKNSSRSYKTKRRSQQHTDLQQIGLIRFNHGLLQKNVQKKWKNYRQQSSRKRTQLRGWDQQFGDYNITQEP